MWGRETLAGNPGIYVHSGEIITLIELGSLWEEHKWEIFVNKVVRSSFKQATNSSRRVPAYSPTVKVFPSC
jgi:hypothetical protein